MLPCEKSPCFTLPTLDNKPYLAIAFDGCFYYLTMPNDKNIYQFDRKFCLKCKIKAHKIFNGLCYDSLEKCFWATEGTRHNVIYKLNEKMQEIDCIKFENIRHNYRQILGISYDCARNILLLAFHDAIHEISKTGKSKVYIKLCPHVLAVASIAPYIAIAINDGENQRILFYKDNELVKTEIIPSIYLIRAIVFNPCEPCLVILATKHCRYPRILFCCVNFDVECCHNKLCGKKCKPHSHGCGDKCNIIDSIAKMETALSHILNAEGEKLQKAVEIAENVDELLETNQSIHKTLMLATQLEQVLYAKLQATTELDCNDYEYEYECKDE